MIRRELPRTELVATPRLLEYTPFGGGWSHLLDAAGVAAALVVPGGIWVC